MYRFSIRRREIFALVFLILGFLIVAALALYSLQTTRNSAERVSQLTDSQILVAEIDAGLNNLLRQLEQLSGDSQPTIDTGASIGLTVDQLSRAFQRLAANEIKDPSFQVANTRFGQIEALFNQGILASISPLNRDRLANLTPQMLDQVRDLRGQMQLLDTQLRRDVARQNAQTDASITATITRTIAALLILAGVSSLLLLSNTLAISSGLQTLTEGAQRLMLRDGGGEIRFPTRRADEFAQLGETFNRLAKAIQGQRIALDQHLAELESARREALSLTERKSAYLANMSHELRAPLHIIMNFISLFQEGELGKLTAEQQSIMGRMAASSGHLLEVINDILDRAKIEAGQIDLHLESVELAPIMQDLRVDVQSLMDKSAKPLSFTLDMPPDLPPVLADELRLKQIMFNLLSNAVRFTDEGGLKVTFAVGIKTLTVSVEDTGIGIPQHKLNDIFERFEQVDRSDFIKRGGSGLGLSIARDLVHMQGGRIWATSQEGIGSIFCFTLPLAPQEQAQPEPEPA